MTVGDAHMGRPRRLRWLVTRVPLTRRVPDDRPNKPQAVGKAEVEVRIHADRVGEPDWRAAALDRCAWPALCGAVLV